MYFIYISSLINLVIKAIYNCLNIFKSIFKPLYTFNYKNKYYYDFYDITNFENNTETTPNLSCIKNYGNNYYFNSGLQIFVSNDIFVILQNN